MKQLSTLFIVLLLGFTATSLRAQEALPEQFSIILGGGVSIPEVEGNKNDFFNQNGNQTGYNLLVEGRYYLLPYFGFGLQYDYLNTTHSPDKMHLHYIHPNILFRHLWANGNQGAFFSLGAGYMDYQERIYKRGSHNGHLYQKGYFGLSLSMGYEFHIVRGLSGMLRADILTADWIGNPDGRLSNPDGYDDGVNHSWFKNNISFLNLGLAVQWGR